MARDRLFGGQEAIGNGVQLIEPGDIARDKLVDRLRLPHRLFEPFDFGVDFRGFRFERERLSIVVGEFRPDVVTDAERDRGGGAGGEHVQPAAIGRLGWPTRVEEVDTGVHAGRLFHHHAEQRGEAAAVRRPPRGDVLFQR